nr:reverse transcriptase domain-containing protein [Tanacetum cinerariifolium]
MVVPRNYNPKGEMFLIASRFPTPPLAWAAHRWLEKKPPHSITTWDDLVSKFINEFFPPSRTTNLRNEISNFQQKFDESFHEAWERYKDLLRVCPHHGFTELHQLDTFYNALNPADQDSLNAAAGGNLLDKSPQDALTIIENKSKDFSRDDVLFSPDNEDKVFNPGILSHEKSAKIIVQEKKLAVSFASWLFEDFDPPFYELLVFKEVSNSMRLLPFSSK